MARFAGLLWLGLSIATTSLGGCAGVSIEDRTPPTLRRSAAGYEIAAGLAVEDAVVRSVSADVTVQRAAGLDSRTIALTDPDGDGRYAGTYTGDSCETALSIAYRAAYSPRGSGSVGVREPERGEFLKWIEGRPPARCPEPVPGKLLEVNTTADLADPNPSDEQCGPRPSPGMRNTCSLRAAIMTANARPGPDRIVLRGQRYLLTLRGRAEEEEAATGDLDVTDSVIIEGVGPEATVIDATSLGDRVLEVHGAGRAPSVQIRGLSLMGGTAYGVPGFGGGGLANDRGVVFLRNVLVELNRGRVVAGIYNAGSLTIEESAVRRNEATDNYPGTGGILNGRTAYLRIERSSLSENVGLLRAGGAVRNEGELDILNSTIADNRSSRAGGAIYNAASGSAVLRNVTIAGNEVRLPGDAILTYGTREAALASASGGIEDSGAVLISNSVIAANRTAIGTDVRPSDCLGTISSLGHSLIAVADGCTVDADLGLGNDRTGTRAAPLEAGLQPVSSGSPSYTLVRRPSPAGPLVRGGAAIRSSEVSWLACLPTDQLGQPRPAAGRCTIGAVEVGS